MLVQLDKVANDIVRTSLDDLPAILRFGLGGVDLFFVTSGLVIAHVTHAQRFELRRFFWRRVRPVVPTYWLVTAVFIALAFASVSVFVDARHAVASFSILPQESYQAPFLQSRLAAPSAPSIRAIS
jgi:peptidoglycan/LPS O-acetylase OafA/YrhL